MPVQEKQRQYDLDAIKDILSVQNEIYRIANSPHESNDDVITLIQRMKKYPGAWPEDVISQLDEMSKKTRSKDFALDAATRQPDFHHALSGEIGQYEEGGGRHADELRTELSKLCGEKEQLLKSLLE